MRGHADDQLPLFHVFRVEDRIRADHPLRDIKRRVDRILDGMSAAFDAAYSCTGRPSVPPERLLKGCYCNVCTRSGASGSCAKPSTVEVHWDRDHQSTRLGQG